MIVMNDILLIKPVLKDYAWGNDYYLADLLDIDKKGPLAELWMGCHEQGSAIISETEQSLYEYLDLNPEFAGVGAKDFPYLFKVLAIAQGLSIQCHPDAQQARVGFDKESEIRKIRDRKYWNYQDSNPKAEMLYALTPVTAMCGFRTFENAQTLFKNVVPVFYKQYFSEVGTIFELFDKLYRLDKEALEYGQAELIKNSDLLDDVQKKIVSEIADNYFGDPGVFAPLFLNIVQLDKGQAVYLKPTVLHSYCSGNGVELMNNSDNVLRAGLTSKHVDLEELELVMSKEPYEPKPMKSISDEGGLHFVCDGGFTLTVMEKGVFKPEEEGPRVILCLDGQLTINNDFVLSKGQCCIIGKAQKDIVVDCSNAYAFMASSN